jgi:hypothetical protein
MLYVRGEHVETSPLYARIWRVFTPQLHALKFGAKQRARVRAHDVQGLPQDMDMSTFECQALRALISLVSSLVSFIE